MSSNSFETSDTSLEKEQSKIEIIEPTYDDIPAMIYISQNHYLNNFDENNKENLSLDDVNEYIKNWNTPDVYNDYADRMRLAMDSPDFLFRLAIENNKPVGLLCAAKEGDEQYIQGVMVDKDHIGKGLSHILMDEALKWLDRSKPTYIDVLEYNKRAIAFYKKYGFEIVENSEHIEGDILPEINMVLPAKEVVND